MKPLLFLGVLFSSLCAQADIVRLTDMTCTNAENTHSIVMNYDSSFSPFGAKVFLVNGQAPRTNFMRMGEEAITHAIGLENNKKANFDIPYADRQTTTGSGEKTFETILSIGTLDSSIENVVDAQFNLKIEDSIKMNCEVKTNITYRSETKD